MSFKYSVIMGLYCEAMHLLLEVYNQTDILPSLRLDFPIRALMRTLCPSLFNLRATSKISRIISSLVTKYHEICHIMGFAK